MNRLRQLRLEREWTLPELAARVGIPRRRLQDYESGRRRPSLHTLERWLRALGLRSDDIRPEWFPDQAYYDARADASVDEWQIDEGESWATMQRGYWSHVKRLGPLPHLSREFRRAVRVDSALEVLAWMQLLRAGAVPRVLSPLKLGFRAHQVGTQSGMALGTARRACLVLQLDDAELTVWPQITLTLDSVSCRVDALVLYHRRERNRWCIVEIDGPHHDNRAWDQERDARFRVPVHRFTADEVKSLRWVDLLLERLRQPQGALASSRNSAT